MHGFLVRTHFHTGFLLQKKDSNMICVFCLYKQITKIQLLISRYTTVLFSGTDGTDLLF